MKLLDKDLGILGLLNTRAEKPLKKSSSKHQPRKEEGEIKCRKLTQREKLARLTKRIESLLPFIEHLENEIDTYEAMLVRLSNTPQNANKKKTIEMKIRSLKTTFYLNRTYLKKDQESRMNLWREIRLAERLPLNSPSIPIDTTRRTRLNLFVYSRVLLEHLKKSDIRTAEQLFMYSDDALTCFPWMTEKHKQAISTAREIFNARFNTRKRAR